MKSSIRRAEIHGNSMEIGGKLPAFHGNSPGDRGDEKQMDGNDG